MARQCARHGAVGWHGIVGAHGEEPGPHLRQQIIELLEEGGGPTLDSTSTQGHAGAVCESSGLMSTRTSRTLPTLLKVSDFAASSCPDERTRRRTLMLRRAVILHAGRCLCMPVTDSQEAGALTHRTCCRHVIKFNSAGFELISKTKTQPTLVKRGDIRLAYCTVSTSHARLPVGPHYTALACSATPCRQRSYPPPGTHRRASKAYRSPAAAVRAAHESQWFGDARNDLNVRLKHLEILCYDKTAG